MEYKCEEHNLEKRCRIEGCTRLGKPQTCQQCGKKSRRSLCPKHRKPKYQAIRAAQSNAQSERSDDPTPTQTHIES